MTTGAAQAATGDLGAPQEQPMPEGAGAKPELTTSSVEESLRTLFAGTEPTEPKEAGQESPPAAEAEQAAGSPEEEHEDEQTRRDLPEYIQRRVDRLTAQKAELREQAERLQGEKEAAEAKAAELEAKLAEAEQAPPVPSNEPLGFIQTPKQLSEYVTAVKEHLRNIEDYLDGALEEGKVEAFTAWAKQSGAVDENGEMIPGKLKQLKRLAQDALSDHVPKRMNYIRQEQQASAEATKEFPWLGEPKSQQAQLLRQLVQAFPEIKRVPAWKWGAALWVEGFLGHKSRTATGTAGAGKPTPPKLPGASTAVPQRPSNGEANGIQALREKAFKTGNSRDFEALIKAQLEA